MKPYKYKQANKHSWIADNGNGTFTNPILYVDYSDPDVCRVGEDYFMVASSFCNAPGLPLLHSKDLVNWKLINYCIKSIPGKQFDLPRHGCGVWAPAIRYMNDEFVVFFPMPDEGIYVVKTKDPWGEWDEPICLWSGKGWIDPCPLGDGVNRTFMVNAFAKSRIGYKSKLQIVELSPDCTKIIGEPKIVFDGNIEDEETIEGPKLYKRNGYYYIFAPAGGVKQGWQTVLRSKNIWGPYEKKRVLMQMDTPINGPHQGGWVDTPKGEDWFIHFQDVYAAGRIVHLQPMRWENDWPVIGDEGKPVIEYKKPKIDNRLSDKSVDYEFDHINNDDDFTSETLNLRWQWNANYKDDFYYFGNNHELRLNALANKEKSIASLPNLLLQKWSLPEFDAVTCINLEELEIGDVTGLVSLGVAYGAVGVRKTKEGYEVISISGEQEFKNEIATSLDKIKLLDTLPINTKELLFKCEVRQVDSTNFNCDGNYKFSIPREMISLYYGVDSNSFTKTCCYEAKAGRWVGVKHGVFAYHEGNENGGNAGVLYYKYMD